ncbi:MAG: LLM class flavin-dependent oxidoreductase [Hyphomicrobiaceae bacterium]
MSRQMHINLFIQSRGHHEASWRHPGSSPLPLEDIDYTVEQARKAEAGLFDSIFLADVLGLWNDVRATPFNWLEPITTLSAVAMATTHIGLIGTASTTYTEPYNLARQFASLDHISRGRAGWNIVTTWSHEAGANYGGHTFSHADRYERAEEYMKVVTGLWDSWSDDAVIDDRAGGLYADPARVRRVDHDGPHYKVKGPLNLPRSPQGRPVFVQAGSSDTGRRFAARHAETVFTAHMEKATAQAFYADLKALVPQEGRDPAHVHILPGFSPVIAETEAGAQRYADDLNALADVEIGRSRLSARFGGYDFSRIPLDKVLSADDDFPDTRTVEASRSRTEVIVGLVRREKPTMRQLLAKLAGARGHFTCTGTPSQVADLMQDWFESGACDGFNLMPPVLPEMLDVFIAEVVPILQKRGLFRTAYGGRTLRDHLGLERPKVLFGAR